MTSDEVYNSVKNLPYADHLFKATPKFIGPINFTLESDSSRTATLFTVYDAKDVPMNLIQVLEDEFNQVVEEGSKYPHHKPLHADEFIRYWFTHCVGILIEGDYGSVIDVGELSIEQWHDNSWVRFLLNQTISEDVPTSATEHSLSIIPNEEWGWVKNWERNIYGLLRS